MLSSQGLRESNPLKWKNFSGSPLTRYRSPSDTHLATVQVPVGDVAARVLQNMVGEERRNEIHPSLIGEHHPRDVDQRLTPVRCHHQSRKGRAESPTAMKPKIVDADRQHEEGVDVPIVLRIGPRACEA